MTHKAKFLKFGFIDLVIPEVMSREKSFQGISRGVTAI
jgi:hypothetical protein